jgi:ubiquitin C-terminal hydrolase
MDGDNKVDCEICAQKKATIRRTCIGNLPNTMVLHLKRFDLDFQTFETVKLNNRMAFSTRLNMLKYTKEGIFIYMYLYIYERMFAFVYTYLYIYLNLYLYLYVYMNTLLYVYVYTYVYTYVWMYIY